MHERFLTMNSLFAQEVREKGLVLYEKHPRVQLITDH